MTPDTCAPTSTVVTAWTVPVARIRRVIWPSVTVAVETCTSVVVRTPQAIAPPSTATVSASHSQIERPIPHLHATRTQRPRRPQRTVDQTCFAAFASFAFVRWTSEAIPESERHALSVERRVRFDAREAIADVDGPVVRHRDIYAAAERIHEGRRRRRRREV